MGINPKALIRQVQYKAGWAFSVDRIHGLTFDRDEPWGLQISHKPLDALEVNDGCVKQIITVQVRHTIPFCLLESESEREFFRWVRMMILEMETHECDEWLKINGVAQWYPHLNQSTN